MIKITKASAGSGKTYTLAKHFITLLLGDRRKDAFRHILAVTFTNKATEEMKRRIIKELHILASDTAESDYFKDFVPALFPDAASLGEKSAEVLSAILNDYGSFAVSTIDKFFQSTLRAFSREIGQLASYKVELDRDSLIREAVGRLLDSLTAESKNEPVLKWLSENAVSLAEDGERAKYDKKLEEYALKLYGQQFRSELEKAGLAEEDFLDPGKISTTKEYCKSFREKYLGAIRAASEKVKAEWTASSIPESSIKSFKNSIGAIISPDFTSGKFKMPGKIVMGLAEGTDVWFNKNKSCPVPFELEKAVFDFLALFGEKSIAAYKTVCLIEKQFYGLGLARAIKDEFEALVKEKNVLNLDDSNSILRAIIDDSDAPFIYEKVGVRFDRFLLDEFQDTSNIQWENFKPLLKESVSKAGDEYVQGDDLIVGDVKQSIYRWRDSDWRLLQSAVKSTFALYADDRTTLDTNYRSLGEVINFNNAFFAKAAEWVDKAAGEDGYDTARTIYGDVAQKIKKGNEEGGYVSIRFADGEEGERLKVKEAVAEALEAGYREKDIAVLCRKNRECGIVAYDLIGEGYNVITTASLKVSASPAVCHLAALLSLMDNPDDAIAEYYCSSLGVRLPERADSLTDLCEEILREMKDAGENVDGEIPYIECFLDLVLEYSKNYGNDLHGFLEWYEGKAPKTYISQPGDTDAVTIMTIHKSKGLEFPVVIVPFAETITMRFKKTSEKWAAPKLDGTPLDGAVDGIYNVNMTSTGGTLFAESSDEELRMTRIDGLNDAYVALTRAGEALYIIAAGTEVDKYEHIGEFLRKYVDETGTDEYGKLKKMGGKEKKPVKTLGHSVFESWPLNPEYVSILDEDGEMTDIREGGRLKFSTDSVDFFDDDGNAGTKASRRIRGIVLHNILSKVVVPDDLPKAVEDSVRAGELSEEEGVEALARLSSGIRRKAVFFPDDRSLVFNEVSLADTDGTVSRPDRVIDDGENVLIIDYKFGAERPAYKAQIERYKALYETMGRKNVKAELWYVDRD